MPYFHVVFTLPTAIAELAYQNKAVVYDLLFKAASETVLTIAADPKHLGARIGITRKYFGNHAEADKVMETAIAEMKRVGAEIIDPVEIENDGINYGTEPFFSFWGFVVFNPLVSFLFAFVSGLFAHP